MGLMLEMRETWPTIDDSMDDLLSRWGEWVRDEERKGGYPKAATIWRLMRYGSGARSVTFYDSVGEMPPWVEAVERNVASMKRDVAPKTFRAVMAVYVGGRSIRVAAKYLKTTRYDVQSRLKQAHNWLKVPLSDYCNLSARI